MKRLGPDLKDLRPSNLKLPSELRVPGPLRDFFLDLRDRRLLPFLALLVVAIVAVPILLADGGEEAEPVTSQPSTGIEDDTTARLSVVEAQPGLRDYRERLKARSASNPFKQRYTAPITKGAELPSVSETAEGTKSSKSTTDGSNPGGEGSGSGGGSGGGGGSGSGPREFRFYTFALDVQISQSETLPDGTTKMGAPQVKKGVRSPAPLPGEKTPVVTFLGVKAKGKKLNALLLVSDEVTGVFGEGRCVSGGAECELLEVEPGFPELFEYGPQNVRYQIKVIDIDVVQTGSSKGRRDIAILR